MTIVWHEFRRAKTCCHSPLIALLIFFSFYYNDMPIYSPYLPFPTKTSSGIKKGKRRRKRDSLCTAAAAYHARYTNIYACLSAFATDVGCLECKIISILHPATLLPCKNTVLPSFDYRRNQACTRDEYNLFITDKGNHVIRKDRFHFSLFSLL